MVQYRGLSAAAGNALADMEGKHHLRSSTGQEYFTARSSMKIVAGSEQNGKRPKFTCLSTLVIIEMSRTEAIVFNINRAIGAARVLLNFSLDRLVEDLNFDHALVVEAVVLSEGLMVVFGKLPVALLQGAQALVSSDPDLKIFEAVLSR